MADPERAFVVHCPDCRHEWAAAYLPMLVSDFVRVAKRAVCPKGCKAKVLCGPANG